MPARDSSGTKAARYAAVRDSARASENQDVPRYEGRSDWCCRSVAYVRDQLCGEKEGGVSF